MFNKQLSKSLNVYVLLDVIKTENGNDAEVNLLVLKISTHTVRVTLVDDSGNQQAGHSRSTLDCKHLWISLLR